MGMQHTVTPCEAGQYSAFRGDCTVALLDSSELREDEYTHFLSPAERAKYVGIRNQRRRSEWLAGRLAAKYLFLSDMETSSRRWKNEWKPVLTMLSSEDLDLYSPWMYQKVEVLPVGRVGKKPNPYLGFIWCDEKRPESISVSHTNNMSCACLTFGCATTIDIESAVPRVSSFYKNSFTEVEKAWVSHYGSGDDGRANWLFALLWTLKESALKLEVVHPASVWQLPQIEIEALPDLDNVLQFSSDTTFGVDFFRFKARVREQHSVMQVQVAVTGTRTLILSVMQPVSGVTN